MQTHITCIPLCYRFLETLDSALHLHMNSIKKKELLKTVYNFCLLGLVPASAINKLLEENSLGELVNFCSQKNNQVLKHSF